MSGRTSQSTDLQNLLQPFFELFRQPDVAVGLALLILAVAVVVFLWFTLWHVWPAIRTLKRLWLELKAIPDHDAFNRDFAQIDQKMSAERLLTHAWKEFKETLIMPDKNSATIRNTVRPSAYLNVGSVASKLELPLYQSIPNYFVGVGLFFTFCGLVAAIRFASEGVGGDVDQAKAALGDLLTAATFKFATSIAGLGSSISLSVWFKLLTLRLQRYFDRVCELLEERMHFVTPEWLSVQQTDELRKQTVQLERFNTDFAVEVAKALEIRLNTSLGTTIGSAVQPMVAAIEGMSKNFSSMNQDAIERMIGDFKTSIQGAAGTEMTAIVSSLESLKKSLEKTFSDIGETGGSFGGRIDSAADRLEKMIGGAAQMLESGVAETASKLERTFSAAAEKAGGDFANQVGLASKKLDDVVAPFAGQLNGLERTLNALDGRLKAQLDGFDGSVGQLRAIIGDIGATFEQLRIASAPIAQTADKFALAATQIENSSSAMKQLQASLGDAAKAILEGAQRVQQSWENYRQRFEKVDTDLSAAFDRIQKGTEAYNGKIREFVVEVDQHLTKAINLLGGGVEQLQNTVEELAEATDKLARVKV